MPTDGTQRPWRTIANELAKETEPTRIVQLSLELQAAYKAQGPAALPIFLNSKQVEKVDSKL
jgi:hypothetical protein